MRVSRQISALCAAALLLPLSACTTTAAKKAMSAPVPKDRYSGFDHDAGDESRRTVAKPEAVKDNADPETAVGTLAEQLKKDRANTISAEEQLKWWGTRQGVGAIVVRKVRPLLKNSRAEIRAPALRLTILFGDESSHGDLIEALADEEYGMRATAFRALRARTNKDFGYDPSGGVVARAQSVDSWRQWWQTEQRRMAVQAPSVYELNQPSAPHVSKAGQEEEPQRQPARNTAPKESAPEQDSHRYLPGE